MVENTEEPSIEEILNSIRQIISDDENAEEESDEQVVEIDLTPQEEEKQDDTGFEIDLTPQEEEKQDDVAFEIDLTPQEEEKQDDSAVEVDLTPQEAEAPQDNAVEVDLTPQEAEAPQDNAVEVDLTPQEAEASQDNAVEVDLTPQQPQPENIQDNAVEVDLSPEEYDMNEEPLDLTENLVVDDAAATAAPQEVEETAPEMPDLSAMESAAMPSVSGEPMISSQAITESASALSKLIATNIAVEKAASDKVGSVTLEDMALEMMRPIIKAWLDENLSKIVEKIVQKEVIKLTQTLKDQI